VFGAISDSRSETRFTQASATERAERIFAAYLNETGLKRSAFSEPFVEISDGNALVNFQLRSSEDEGVIISLGNDGSRGISPNIPSHDFPISR